MKRSLKLKPEFRIKFSNTRVFLALAFWGLPTVAFAADFCAGLVHAKFSSQSEQRVSKLKPGSLAVLTHTSLDQQLETHFLGRIQNAGGSSHSYLFYDTASQEIHSIPADRVALSDAQGSAIEASRGKLYVRSENQEGPTCAAYSLFNCLRQVALDEKAPDRVRLAVSDESHRIKLLMKAVNEIYIGKFGNALPGAIEKLATEHQLRTFTHPSSTIEEFRASILRDLNSGWPVLTSFSVPEKMVETAYSIFEHDSPEIVRSSKNLWIPASSTTTRSHDAHVVVLLAAFEAQGEEFILVSDPNWQMPRIWPASYLDRLFSGRMAASTVWFEDAK
ncbi:MAG: hypothetical protein H7222_02495 [Methylotenera sp.]|nr:hypothetical protein [Oligoflexia bacterium]